MLFCCVQLSGRVHVHILIQIQEGFRVMACLKCSCAGVSKSVHEFVCLACLIVCLPAGTWLSRASYLLSQGGRLTEARANLRCGIGTQGLAQTGWPA